MTNWYGQPPSPEQHPEPNTSTQPLNWANVHNAQQYPPPYGTQQPHPGPDYWYPPQPGELHRPPAAPLMTRKPRRGIAALAMAAIVAIAVGGAVIATDHSSGNSGQTSAITSPYLPSQQFGGGYGGGSSGTEGGSGSQGQVAPTDPTDPGGSTGGQSTPQTPDTGSGTTTSQQATAAQQVGVVDINTVLNYGEGEAAGTGMVLTANGEILTNNHVIDGATTIKVTVVSTGKTYTAKLVGTDPTDDVAVLQLTGASGLTPANIGDSSKVAVGDAVTAVGNAGGTGGTPSAAAGTVTALDKTITASDQGGSDSETLTGMIEVAADIQAGDSGGPLYAADNTVVGMDTAASSGRTADTIGYAIPIAKAMAVADQIEAGNASDTIQIGTHGFLGVEVGSSTFGSSGATIAGVVENSAAAKAGLAAGDTITAVNGTAIASADELTSTLSKSKAGQQVSVTWLDTAGQSHTATVTLAEGPA
jgi:S1-C subfamily serine protease